MCTYIYIITINIDVIHNVSKAHCNYMDDKMPYSDYICESPTMFLWNMFIGTPVCGKTCLFFQQPTKMEIKCKQKNNGGKSSIMIFGDIMIICLLISEGLCLGNPACLAGESVIRGAMGKSSN